MYFKEKLKNKAMTKCENSIFLVGVLWIWFLDLAECLKKKKPTEKQSTDISSNGRGSNHEKRVSLIIVALGISTDHIHFLYYFNTCAYQEASWLSALPVDTAHQ